MEFAVLIVTEEDGSATYYRLSENLRSTLNYINGHTFGFYANGIVCTDDKSINVTPDIHTFLMKFRGGRFTRNWKGVAERIKIVEPNTNPPICQADTYEIFLTH